MAEQTTPVRTRQVKTRLKSDRRAWLRFPSEQDIICQLATNRPKGEPEVAWLGAVRDVSPAGIGLSVTRRFEPGAELIIELSAKGVLHIPVRVVHATADKKGRWILGCEFASLLSEQELKDLLGSLPRTAA